MDSKSLIKGCLVEVTDFEGRKLLRKAVEICGNTVYICTEDEFDAALKSGKEPLCVGFQLEFVRPVTVR
jgi:hypothetical protein